MIVIVTIFLITIVKSTAVNQLYVYSPKCQRDTPFVIDFQIYKYAPQPSQLTLTAEIINFNIPNICQISYTFTSFLTSPPIKRGIVILGDGCSFAQKAYSLKKLQNKLDLVIIRKQNHANLQKIREMHRIQQKDLLPIIMVDEINGNKLQDAFDKCSGHLMIDMTMAKDNQIPISQLADISIPQVYFLPDQEKGFKQLIQFYQHHMFQSFKTILTLNHQLIYTHIDCDGITCSLQRDCLQFKQVNKRYCYASDDFHAGRDIILQQIRSYIILQQIGKQKWLQYVELFSQKMCRMKNVLKTCSSSALIELEVSKDLISIITKETQAMAIYQHFALTFDKRLKIIKKNKTNVSFIYRSKIYNTLTNLCQKQQKSPKIQCSYIRNQHIKFQINNYDSIDYNFLQPNFMIYDIVSRQVQIKINQQVVNQIQEIAFILNAEGPLINRKIILPFRRIFKDKYSFIGSGIKFISQPFKNRQQKLVLKKNQSAINEIILTIPFDHYQVYTFKIIPITAVAVVMINAKLVNRLISFIPTIFQLVLSPFLSNDNEYYEVIMYGSIKQLLISFALTPNIQYKQRKSQINREITNKITKFSISQSQHCWQISLNLIQTLINEGHMYSCNSNNINNCSLFMFIEKITNKQQQLISLKLNILNQASNVRQYRQNYNKVMIKSSILQYNTMSNLFWYFPWRYSQVWINLTMNSNTMAQFRVCKNYTDCQLQKQPNWNTTYENMTDLLLNLSYKDSHTINKISFNYPAFSIARFKKIHNFTLYIIYRLINYTIFSGASQVTQTLTFYYLFYYNSIRRQIYRNRIDQANTTIKYYLYGNTYQWNQHIAIYLLVHNADLNIKIYTQVYSQKDDRKYLFLPFNNTNNKLKKHTLDQNYYQLILYYIKDQNIFIDVYVEDNLNLKNRTQSKLYQIGLITFNNVNQLNYLISQNSNINTFTQTYYQNRTQHYVLYPTENIVILSFQTVDANILKDLMFCFYQQNLNCFFQKDMKYWKELEGEKISKGFKFVNETAIFFNVYHSNESQAKQFIIVTKGVKDIKEVDSKKYQTQITTIQINKAKEKYQIKNEEKSQQLDEVKAENTAKQFQMRQILSKPNSQVNPKNEVIVQSKISIQLNKSNSIETKSQQVVPIHIQNKQMINNSQSIAAKQQNKQQVSNFKNIIQYIVTVFILLAILIAILIVIKRKIRQKMRLFLQRNKNEITESSTTQSIEQIK